MTEKLTETPPIVEDWTAKGQYQFLPGYKQTKTTTAGFDEHGIYTMTAKEYFGQLSIAEPIDSDTLHQLKMEASEIHFHFPSEHAIDGERGDLEMQIYHEIPDATMKQRAFHCSSARAAVAIIFKASDTESEFLKWQS